MRKTTMVTHHLIPLIVLCLAATAAPLPTSKPGCPDRCRGSSVILPYPFGIGSKCSANQTFTISCNSTNFKPILNSINLEILEIILANKTMLVNSPVTTWGCSMTSAPLSPPVHLGGTPFSYNNTHNMFTGIGCNIVAQLFDLSTTGTPIAGCIPLCNTNSRRNESGCYGMYNCCQTEIPHVSLQAFNVSLASVVASNECRYGFIVEQEWFSKLTSPYAVEGMEYVPALIDWDTDEKCYFNEMFPYTRLSNIPWGCLCRRGYEGNAYLPNGCQETHECRNAPRSFWCGGIVSPKKKSTLMLAIVGISSGLAGLFLVVAAWTFCKIIKRKKMSKLKNKFFKRNGGLLLQQQMPSAEQGSYVEKTKLFTSKELDIATDRYNKNRILGRGGQGTVYKGMLTEGKIVAVKKSTIVDEGKLEEFINEVVILSQINHRNVVKLHGCCLETEVPLLVYEFIPNGNLLEYIQDQQNEEFPLTWNVRLRIASEVAGALAYLHSAASVPIYHRDIKSSNILLDEKYRAKVADFGTSRTLQVDQTHMTTRVQGTFGYLDPEYFTSSHYTDKSDVYSFGVVLLELLTGKRAIIHNEEMRGLVAYFKSSMEEDRLFDIVDDQILEKGDRKEEISAMANLARRCLSMNGKRRPTMKEVAMELEAIRTSTNLTQSLSPVTVEQYEEDDYTISDLPIQWDITAFPVTPDNIEEKPLMSK